MWSAPAPEASTAPAAAAKPEVAPASDADTPVETSETEKQKARAVKFGRSAASVETTAAVSRPHRMLSTHWSSRQFIDVAVGDAAKVVARKLPQPAPCFSYTVRVVFLVGLGPCLSSLSVPS